MNLPNTGQVTTLPDGAITECMGIADADGVHARDRVAVPSILGEYLALLQEPGVIGAEQLQPAESATTVRVENGKTLTTDGPFADTKEVLGGLYLLEADDLDRAGASGAAGEVRALVATAV